MRNKIIFLILLVLIIGCSSGDKKPNDDDIVVLASNVVLVDDWTVDTETKVLARNVVLDNSLTSLIGTNLQSAMEEIAPVVSDILPGSWDTKVFGDMRTGDLGSIVFNSDGTFHVQDGVLDLIQVCDDVDCYYLSDGKWEVIDNMVIKFTNEDNENSFSFYFISGVSSMKMILIKGNTLCVLNKSS